MSTVLDRPVPATTPSYGDVYRLAARLIEECGWRQHAYGDSERGYCLAGAVASAHLIVYGRDIEWSERLFWPLWNGTESPACWNDRPERTKAEVVEKLRAAAGGS